MKRKYWLILSVVFFVTAFLGCNMLRGAGKDVENAGQGVQNIVDKND